MSVLGRKDSEQFREQSRNTGRDTRFWCRMYNPTMGSPPEQSDVPLVRQAPRASVASPSDLRPRSSGALRWYKPTLAETIRLMGWRCVYFAPAVALIAIAVMSFRYVWLLPRLVV